MTGWSFGSYRWTDEVGCGGTISGHHLHHGVGITASSSPHGEDGECMRNGGKAFWPPVTGILPRCIRLPYFKYLTSESNDLSSPLFCGFAVAYVVPKIDYPLTNAATYRREPCQSARELGEKGVQCQWKQLGCKLC